VTICQFQSYWRATGSRRALTFMELLIALCVTSVVCGILAVLISATAAGTNSQNDGRRALIRMQSIKSVLSDEFLNARAILATGTNYVIYWAGDQPGWPVSTNYAVNYSEIRLLEIDSATGNLNLYKVVFPSGSTNPWIISNDATCAANSSWYATCTQLKSTPYYPAITLATGGTALTAALDSATPTSARMINLRIDLNDGFVARQLILGATLVSPQSPY
jgi:hypothetical protein